MCHPFASQLRLQRLYPYLLDRQQRYYVHQCHQRCRYSCHVLAVEVEREAHQAYSVLLSSQAEGRRSRPLCNHRASAFLWLLEAMPLGGTKESRQQRERNLSTATASSVTGSESWFSGV